MVVMWSSKFLFWDFFSRQKSRRWAPESGGPSTPFGQPKSCACGCLRVGPRWRVAARVCTIPTKYPSARRRWDHDFNGVLMWFEIKNRLTIPTYFSTKQKTISRRDELWYVGVSSWRHVFVRGWLYARRMNLYISHFSDGVLFSYSTVYKKNGHWRRGRGGGWQSATISSADIGPGLKSQPGCKSFFC